MWATAVVQYRVLWPNRRTSNSPTRAANRGTYSPGHGLCPFLQHWPFESDLESRALPPLLLVLYTSGSVQALSKLLSSYMNAYCLDALHIQKLAKVSQAVPRLNAIRRPSKGAAIFVKSGVTYDRLSFSSSLLTEVFPSYVGFFLDQGDVTILLMEFPRPRLKDMDLPFCSSSS